jgi:hypothetical protein
MSMHGLAGGGHSEAEDQGAIPRRSSTQAQVNRGSNLLQLRVSPHLPNPQVAVL